MRQLVQRVPAPASQIIAKLSRPPVATRSPAGENAAVTMFPGWSSKSGGRPQSRASKSSGVACDREQLAPGNAEGDALDGEGMRQPCHLTPVGGEPHPRRLPRSRGDEVAVG